MKLIRNIIFIIMLTESMATYSNPIVIGAPQFAPPYSSLGADNHYYGFSIDLMNEICKHLNATCIYKALSIENELDALEKGDIDIVLSLNPIPLEKQPKYVYSMPYIPSNGEFLTLNPNIKSMGDLKNKRFGILEQNHLENILLPLTKKENIKEYNKPNSLLLAMKEHEVDVLLLSVNIARYLIANQVLTVYIIGKPISLGNGYGIMALSKNAELINRINKAILQIENDGTYAPIYSKYFVL